MSTIPARRGVAAQMSTYPMDVRHLEYLLPHQIRVWAPMVDRFIVTLDTHQSRSGRYHVQNFNDNLARTRELLARVRTKFPQLEVIDVDYSDATRRAVGEYFFGSDIVPVKAWDGGPFYAYFFGLYAANAQYVMHFDGDMLFGGGSGTWIREIIEVLEGNPDVLVAAPFPGPPRADGKIFGHFTDPEPVAQAAGTRSQSYRHGDVSTRAFLIDLNRFKERFGVMPEFPLSVVQRAKALLLGNPGFVREAEVLLSNAMRTRGLSRVDLLGTAPGLWSLHPPYRSEEFYRRLPEIVAAVESGRIPEGQRGHYDLNDSMIDWSQARAANSSRKRYWRMFRQRLHI